MCVYHSMKLSLLKILSICSNFSQYPVCLGHPVFYFRQMNLDKIFKLDQIGSGQGMAEPMYFLTAPTMV